MEQRTNRLCFQKNEEINEELVNAYASLMKQFHPMKENGGQEEISNKL